MTPVYKRPQCVTTPVCVKYFTTLVQDYNKEVIKMKDLNSYSKQELIEIIQAYNNYIIDFYDDHDCDSCPVCLDEFIDNDLEFYI